MIQVFPLSAPLAAHPQAEMFNTCGERDLPEEPLYGVLCRLVARSPDLLALMQAAPLTQQQRSANLILAALHDLVLRTTPAGTAPTGLAAWYANLGGRRPPDDPALPQALARFATEHADALRERLATRRTQTNEIGRSAVLRPALDAIARHRYTGKLALFDFGCSAGLNLAVDHYGIQYDHADGTRRIGPGAGGDALLHCAWQGALPQGALPDPPAWTLVARCGCDQALIDVDDDDAMRWLQACLWPGDRARQARLAEARRLTQQLQPPRVAADDGLAVLAAWLQTLPSGVTPVLFNSWVLAYFTPAMLADHRDRVLGLVQGRGLVWLSAEDGTITHQMTGLDLPTDEVLGRARATADTHTFWTLTEPGDGAPQHTLLARSHPHGTWLQWLAP
jgi:hypothetical protein